MSRRRVPIDWDGLEMGLTWHHLDGGGCVLDLGSGEVIGPNDEDVEEQDLDDGTVARAPSAASRTFSPRTWPSARAGSRSAPST